MKHDYLRQFAQLQSARIETGDIDGFVNCFDMPLPIYTPARMTILHSAVPLGRIVQDYAREMNRHGISKLRPAVIDIVEQTCQRALVMVTWDHLDHAGQPRTQSAARYVIRQSPDDAEPKIEMVQYLSMSFPQLEQSLHQVMLN